jgi:diguanylate cyclase (GGDEF)-like protein
MVGLPGLRVVHVTRLKEALVLVHDQDFDTIITELNLTDARGFDAVLRLQASAPRAAIVVHSAVEDEALALQVVQLGAQDYLLKGSVTPQTLIRSLKFSRERKRAELRLRKLAHYDQLTGLVNRPTFVEALAHALPRANRRNHALAVMMIDLDGFKQINDSAGHDAGDLVLRELAMRMRSLFRDYDVVARFGGDEFAVLITDLEATNALADIAERLLVALAEPVGAAGYRVTASIGLSLYPEAGKSPQRLLRSADMAMYDAKRLGKNRWHLSDSPSPGTSQPPSMPAPDDVPSGSYLVAPSLPEDFEPITQPMLRGRVG